MPGLKVGSVRFLADTIPRTQCTKDCLNCLAFCVRGRGCRLRQEKYIQISRIVYKNSDIETLDRTKPTNFFVAFCGKYKRRVREEISHSPFLKGGRKLEDVTKRKLHDSSRLSFTQRRLCRGQVTEPRRRLTSKEIRISVQACSVKACQSLSIRYVENFPTESQRLAFPWHLESLVNAGVECEVTGKP